MTDNQAQPEQTVANTPEARTRSLSPRIKSHLLFWTVSLGGLVLDLWSKDAIFKKLEPGECITLINGCLRFIEALNDGAAFSLMAGQRRFLVSVSIVALIVVLVTFIRNAGRQRWIGDLSLALLAGGIAGNLYDRLFHEGGRVRDFIDAYIGKFQWHWPTFNVADSMLCIGVGILVAYSFIPERPDPKRAD